MQNIRLPNGLDVWAPSRREALVLYREIMDTGAYDRHGIEVRDGDVVLDVGANVGMYSMHLARRHARLRLHAFEPVPETFAMLRRNAADHMADHEVTLHPVGLAAEPGTATFELSTSSFTASMSPEAVDGAIRRRGVLDWTRALVDDGVRAQLVPRIVGRAVGRLLRHERLAEAILTPLSALERLQHRRRTRRITCSLTTISDVMQAHQLGRVDLVKIDAEGAEESVVDGIREEHWPHIRQLVIEVHDVEGRLERMASRLRGRGFTVVTEREDWAILDLMGVQVIFATRTPAPA